MCGIVVSSGAPVSPAVLDRTRHRGPDHSSAETFGPFTLGHNRLSIIDLSARANQPLHSTCGKYAIVYNGEVYNFRELRSELRSRYKFTTETDTEVVLAAYIAWGDRCVGRLRGMFAFAIVDTVRDRLFAARDRLGIKPLVYAHDRQALAIASETKSILPLLPSRPEVDGDAIEQYLHLLYIPEPHTAFRGISKLAPGHTLVYSDGRLTIERYWSVEDEVARARGDELSSGERIERLDELLRDAVRYRMISDVELGCFLSGGLDSSAVLRYMAEASDRPVNTYTLVFPDAPHYDESAASRELAGYFATNHTEIEISPVITDLLPTMVRHFDEPFGNPTSLLIHELTRETRKHATVALAGDGGDEVFGGYSRYQAWRYFAVARVLPRWTYRGLNSLAGLLRERADGNHTLRRVKAFIDSLSSDEGSIYDRWVGYFTPEELTTLLRTGGSGARSIVRDLWDQYAYHDRISRSQIVDLLSFLPNNLLHYGDAMSMANSFEVRFPLIDHRLVGFMLSLPTSDRIRGTTTKHLLRRALDGHVPASVLSRRKKGLNPPVGLWLQRELRPLLDDYLSREAVRARGLLEPGTVANLLREHREGRRDRSLHIWALIVLEEWFRQYVDKTST